MTIIQAFWRCKNEAKRTQFMVSLPALSKRSASKGSNLFYPASVYFPFLLFTLYFSFPQLLTLFLIITYTKTTPPIQHNSSNLAHHWRYFESISSTIREWFESNSRQLALWLTPSLNFAYFNIRYIFVLFNFFTPSRITSLWSNANCRTAGKAVPRNDNCPLSTNYRCTCGLRFTATTMPRVIKYASIPARSEIIR